MILFRSTRSLSLSVALILTMVSTAPVAAPAKAKTTLPDQITIAALLPLTGPGANFGEIMKNGTELAVETINAAGGIGGKTKIKVVYEDHRGQPKLGVISMNKVIEVDKVPFVLSSYSSVSLAIAPIGEKAKVTIINGGGQGNELAGANRYLFNDIPVVGAEVDVMAKYTVEKLGKKAAILYATEDFGLSASAAFKEAFTKYGGQIVAMEGYQYGATDVRAQLAKIKAANPEIIYQTGHGRDSIIVLQQIKEMGLTATIVGTSVTISAGVQLDPSAQGMYHTMLSWEPNGAFVTAYKTKYQKDPDTYVSNYYNGVLIFKKAVEYAADQGWEINGESVRKAIVAIRKFDGVNGFLVFNDKNVATSDMNITVIGKDQKDQIIERVKVAH